MADNTWLTVHHMTTTCQIDKGLEQMCDDHMQSNFLTTRLHYQHFIFSEKRQPTKMT